MRRYVVLIALGLFASTHCHAISLFNRHWKEHYLEGNRNALFVTTARRAGCYVCHVKGKKKEDVRNEYGKALEKYLDTDDFPKEWVEANPEEARRRIIAAFKQVEEDLSKDKLKYGEKIDNGTLPAIDSGL